MDRDALAESSREQLIELVPGLAAEVAELKGQQGQPPKMPGRSSVPPSVGFKASRVDRRARKHGENLFQALRTVAGPSPLDACSVPAFVEARAA